MPWSSSRKFGFWSFHRLADLLSSWLIAHTRRNSLCSSVADDQDHHQLVKCFLLQWNCFDVNRKMKRLTLEAQDWMARRWHYCHEQRQIRGRFLFFWLKTGFAAFDELGRHNTRWAFIVPARIFIQKSRHDILTFHDSPSGNQVVVHRRAAEEDHNLQVKHFFFCSKVSIRIWLTVDVLWLKVAAFYEKGKWRGCAKSQQMDAGTELNERIKWGKKNGRAAALLTTETFTSAGISHPSALSSYYALNS